MANPYTKGEHVQASALTITGGAASVAIIDHAHRIKLLRWGFTVTTAVVIGTTDAVLTLFKVAFDRSTQTSLDVITIETARAVGHVEYTDLHGVAASNNPIQQGEAVEIDHTTAASGGSAAGAVKVWYTYEILGPIWNSTYHHSV
jgi:hypothetical protein